MSHFRYSLRLLLGTGRKAAPAFVPLLALLAAFTGCAKREAAVSDTVRFGHPSNPAGTTEWAIYRNILQPELATVGINHIVDYPSAAGPQLNEAFAARTLDVFSTGDTPALIGKASGLRYRLIDIDVTHTNNSLYVRQDGPKSVADLVGKKVPVSQGTNAMHYVYGVLTEAGILDKVQIISLDSGGIETALQRGDIDAASSQTPEVMEAKGYRIIDRASDHQGLYGNIPVVAGEDFLDQHPGFVAAWNRARAKAIVDMQAHPDEYYAWLAKIAKFPPELLPQTYPISSYNPEPITPQAVEELGSLQQFLVDQQIVRHPVPVTDWIADEARPALAAGTAAQAQAQVQVQTPSPTAP